MFTFQKELIDDNEYDFTISYKDILKIQFSNRKCMESFRYKEMNEINEYSIDLTKEYIGMVYPMMRLGFSIHKKEDMNPYIYVNHYDDHYSNEIRLPITDEDYNQMKIILQELKEYF
jgi:hypothetical protein